MRASKRPIDVLFSHQKLKPILCCIILPLKNIKGGENENIRKYSIKY